MGRVERKWEHRKRGEGRGKDGGMGGEGEVRKLHHRAKFRTSRSSRSGDMADFLIFQDGGRRHLGFWKF